MADRTLHPWLQTALKVLVLHLGFIGTGWLAFTIYADLVSHGLFTRGLFPAAETVLLELFPPPAIPEVPVLLSWLPRILDHYPFTLDVWFYGLAPFWVLTMPLAPLWIAVLLLAAINGLTERNGRNERGEGNERNEPGVYQR